MLFRSEVDSDTTSEISDIPDDGDHETNSSCDNASNDVPCKQSESHGSDSDDEYSREDDGEDEEYSGSSSDSYNSSLPVSATCNKVTRDDRHDNKQECSPLDVSLGQDLSPNEDTKTTELRSGNQANFDKVDTNQSEIGRAHV